MMPNELKTLRVSREHDVVTVSMNRPDVRNAFNETMIRELTETFSSLAKDEATRAIVLRGEGKVFCAGADIEWMRSSIDRSESENLADAEAMARMYETIDSCPVPVIGRLHQAAFGGAVGLLAVCDIVVAARGSKICFSEVRLGILPAVISSFSIAKIGVAQARRYFITAEVFTAEDAPTGLIHVVVEESELDERVFEFVKALRQVGPRAVREIKALIPRVAELSHREALQLCTRTIARVRVSAEAQAGLRSFLSKSEPPWQSEK